MPYSRRAASSDPDDAAVPGGGAGLGSRRAARAELLQDLFDTTSDLIQICGADGTLRLVNRAWCEHLGYAEAEVIGRPVFDLIAPDCREHCRQLFQELLDGQAAQPIHCVFLSRQGRRLTLEGQLDVVWVDGAPGELRGIFRDVSERREAEQALQQLNATLEARVRERTRELDITKARLEEAQALASVGHWEMDLRTGALHWSDEICRICGLDPHTAVPDYGLFIEQVHPEDRGMLEAAYQQSLQTREPCDLRYRLRRTDGSLRQIHARWTTDFDAHGQPLRSIGTSQDVTDFEQSQRDLQDSEDKLRSLFESSPAGLVLVEGGERFGLTNPAFLRISGLTQAQVLDPPADRPLPTPLQDLRRLSQELEAGRAPATAIRHWPGPDGGSIVVQLQASAVRAEAEPDRPALVWVQVDDISERLAAEDNLRLAAKVFHSAAEGIFLTDADGVIVDANEALCRITGYGRAELLGQTPRLFKSGMHPADFYQQIWASLGRDGVWSGEIVNRARDGSMQDMLETIGVVRDEQGALTHYVALLSDIRQLKEQQRQLERLALYDALTGLPNRVLLAQRLDQSLALLGRSGASMAVGYLDLDGFKEINDQHGHSAGDSLLQTLAQRMRMVLSPGDFVARLGGDEFVLILQGLQPAQQQLPSVQALLDRLVEPVVWNGLVLEITASIGVVLQSAQSGDVTPDQLLRRADQAMYEAKRQGKNRYWVMHG